MTLRFGKIFLQLGHCIDSLLLLELCSHDILLLNAKLLLQLPLLLLHRELLLTNCLLVLAALIIKKLLQILVLHMR